MDQQRGGSHSRPLAQRRRGLRRGEARIRARRLRGRERLRGPAAPDVV